MGQAAEVIVRCEVPSAEEVPYGQHIKEGKARNGVQDIEAEVEVPVRAAGHMFNDSSLINHAVVPPF